MSSKNPSIHLTGAISLSNKGTAAIVISFIESLRKLLPSAEISIELVYPEKQKSLYDLEKNFSVRVVPPLFQSPVKALFLFLLALLIKPISFLHSNFLHVKALDIYQHADLVIDISAEAFITYFDDDLLQQCIRFGTHLYPILLAFLLGRPVAIIAQTLGPFGIFRPIMKMIIGLAKIVTVRDPTSLENMKKEGVKLEKVELTADPAFLLQPHVPPFTPERKGSGPLVGILAARQTGRTLSSQQYENLVNVFSKAVQLLINEKDATVVFIPHSSGKFRKVSDDVQVGLDIQSHVEGKDRFQVIQDDWPPQVLKGFIGCFDVILSLRMHPVIAALTMKVPSVLIGFNDKALGLMERLGLGEYTCRIDHLSAEWMADAVCSCYEKREDIRALLDNSLSQIKGMASKNSQLVYDFLVK
jgi:colanic acid/amylovoran biosynthesis protein